MTEYSNIDSRFTIGNSHLLELFAVPIKRDEKAYLDINDFIRLYAFQNGFNTDGIIAVNHNSELFLKVSVKKPVLLNVFPSQNIPDKTLEIPEYLYARYIADRIAPARKIDALVPRIKEAVEFYGVGNDVFKPLEKWKIDNS